MTLIWVEKTKGGSVGQLIDRQEKTQNYDYWRKTEKLVYIEELLLNNAST
jgi:hypothetical protein